MSNSDTSRSDVAVALVWEARDAPRVVAKGEEALAQEILALAREHDVPLYEDPALARLLSQLELDQEIPPPLYLAVARVIAFAYYLSGRTSVLGEQDV